MHTKYRHSKQVTKNANGVDKINKNADVDKTDNTSISIDGK